MDLTLLSEQNPNDSDQPSYVVEVLGRQLYTRTVRLSENSTTHPPQFVCISYVWGSDRITNPIYPSAQMSSVTLSCLAAALLQYPPDTGMDFWIDAFCIPPMQPQKAITLSSMGLIYSLSRATLACLSPDMAPVLQHIHRDFTMNEDDLHILAVDEWIRSVWTYQEVVNSPAIRFVAQLLDTKEKPGSLYIADQARAVDGQDFLSCLGETLVRSRSRLVTSMPTSMVNLEAFEDLLLDWRTSGYTYRSLLQILSNFPGRVTAEPRNIFYSIIGCLLHKPQRHTFGQTVRELATTLIQVCEEVGDFSYSFTANERQGRSLRPKPEILKAILNWHVYGRGQGGRYSENKFWLYDMVVPEPMQKLNTCSRAALKKLLQTSNQVSPEDPVNVKEDRLIQKVHGVLQTMGFTGSDSPMLFETGVLYSQESFASYNGLQVFISTGLRWTFGHPGILRAKSAETTLFCAGVFVGTVDETEARDICLSE